MAEPPEAEERIAGRSRVAELRELYGALLTARQRELLAWYYDLDLSLGEIAAETGVSRQAVHDLLRRGVRVLEGYERRLGLRQRSQARRERVQGVLAAIARARGAGGPEQSEALARAAELAEGLLED